MRALRWSLLKENSEKCSDFCTSVLLSIDSVDFELYIYILYLYIYIYICAVLCNGECLPSLTSYIENMFMIRKAARFFEIIPGKFLHLPMYRDETKIDPKLELRACPRPQPARREGKSQVQIHSPGHWKNQATGFLNEEGYLRFKQLRKTPKFLTCPAARLPHPNFRPRCSNSQAKHGESSHRVFQLYKKLASKTWTKTWTKVSC